MWSERQRGILFSSQILVGFSTHALGVCPLALPTIGAITPKCRLVSSHPQRKASTPACLQTVRVPHEPATSFMYKPDSCPPGLYPSPVAHL